MAFVVVAHGGAGSSSAEVDGPRRAADRGVEALRKGATPLQAAVEAVVELEDDPRFNAGTGSNLRFDGRTIEMDAACMADDGRFGAVCGIRRVRNPVLAALGVLKTPHVLIAGDGATRFARCLGLDDHDPWTEKAQRKYDKLREQLRAMRLDPSDTAWQVPDLERYWNYETPLRALVGPGDTVGAVATDGTRFAAALSTGGTMGTLLGRIGDVPLPGCGLQVGKLGAIACTGDGDDIARAQLAARVYRFLDEGMTIEQAIRAGIAMLPDNVSIGIIGLKDAEAWGTSNRDMAWAIAKEEKA